jgi:hypothetical protein
VKAVSFTRREHAAHRPQTCEFKDVTVHGFSLTSAMRCCRLALPAVQGSPTRVTAALALVSVLAVAAPWLSVAAVEPMASIDAWIQAYHTSAASLAAHGE